MAEIQVQHAYQGNPAGRWCIVSTRTGICGREGSDHPGYQKPAEAPPITTEEVLSDFVYGASEYRSNPVALFEDWLRRIKEQTWTEGYEARISGPDKNPYEEKP